MSGRRSIRRSDGQGQALVEFALAIPIFIFLLLAVFDFGRGIYMYNGVSQAAREIARAASVDPGVILGQGQKPQAALATQRALVPALGTPTFECVDIAGDPSTADPCTSGNFVRVTITASYAPVSLLGVAGPITLSSTSSVRVP